MLVFLTGQSEISHVMKRLKEDLACTQECMKSKEAGVRIAPTDGKTE